MKKVLSILLLTIGIIIGTTLFSACNFQKYSDHEIVLGTNEYLEERYNNHNLYSTFELPNKYFYKNKYEVKIEWFSSNPSIVDMVNQIVYRKNYDQQCELTARVSYKTNTSHVKIIFKIPKQGIIVDAPVIDNL